MDLRKQAAAVKKVRQASSLLSDASELLEGGQFAATCCDNSEELDELARAIEEQDEDEESE